ncbi:MAG: helical backbone metal receptor [Gammaproteobacteria bacterium]
MSEGTELFTDAAGRRHHPARNDCRIVSLVPSLTELLLDLGLDEHLVGRTGFCIHPRDVVKAIPKVGGTKDVNIGKVLDLDPTHVVVNIDENRRETVERLAETVPNIIVTHPCVPEDNIDLYKLMGGIFGKHAEASELVTGFRKELDALHELRGELLQSHVLYLIWRSPWMTVSADTYIAGMLSLINWITVYPETGGRYPVIEDLEATAAGVDRILLSSEPYRFREKHVRECREKVPSAGVMLVDGELLSWYGSRAVRGLRYLGELARTGRGRSNEHDLTLH